MIKPWLCFCLCWLVGLVVVCGLHNEQGNQKMEAVETRESLRVYLIFHDTPQGILCKVDRKWLPKMG